MEVEVALLPGEDAVGAVGAGDVSDASTNSSEPGSRCMRVRRKIFGEGAGFAGGIGRAAPRLRGISCSKPTSSPARRDVDAELLFLQGPKPAIGPAPQADARAHDPVGLLQSGLALEEGFGVVVEGEAGGLPVVRRCR